MVIFPMNDFVSFCTDRQSMFFMSTRILKDQINGVCVPPFQLAYISDTTHSSHRNLVWLCCEVHYMWWKNQYLELQEWQDCIKSIKTIIISVIMLVPKITHRETNNMPFSLLPLPLEKVLLALIE